MNTLEPFLRSFSALSTAVLAVWASTSTLTVLHGAEPTSRRLPRSSTASNADREHGIVGRRPIPKQAVARQIRGAAPTSRGIGAMRSAENLRNALLASLAPLPAGAARPGPQERRSRTAPRNGSSPGRAGAQGGSGPEVADETLRDFDRDCLRSGCHQSLSRRAWTHAPVAVGSCESCHTPDGAPSRHRFRATRPKETACAFCHKAPTPESTVHEPFQKHECLGCHDPHGGPTRALLKSTNEAEVCGACHDPTRQPLPAGGVGGETAPGAPFSEQPRGAPWATLHKPLTEGKCLVCHSPHQSNEAKLLVQARHSLCSSACHQELAGQVASAAHVHEPVGKDCSSCHLPHGGVHAGLLRDKPRALCLSCHEEVAKSLDNPAHRVHGALNTEKSCLGCHRPHDGPTKPLVVLELARGCLECHDEELETAEGRKVANIQKEIEAAKSVHEPITKGQCEACHKSHSSPLRALLAKDYPAEPYQAWNDTAFELCFSCHERSLVTEQESTQTGFRDGRRNLHYVHVHQAKGRSCSLCHATHGSPGVKLMRNVVGFGPGGWQLPLSFESRETGGACGPGCHQALAYDRVSPRVPRAPESTATPDRTTPPRTAGSAPTETESK